MLRAVRLILRLRHTEPLKSIVGVTESLAVLDHNLDEKPDEELVEIIRTRAQTLYHPTSTARMASIDEGKEKSFTASSLRC